MDYKQEIESIIDKSIKTYTHSNDRFLSDYNREVELTKEYNGRQLLELLQNADDAGSEHVSISLNTNSQILSISNDGTPFSIDGINSLMISNLSPKKENTYIGNKGLGFRSILNWAECINIYTNQCKVSFSYKIAKNVFENRLGLTQDDKDQIRSKQLLNDSSIPFPILAIPEIEHKVNSLNRTTTIEIKYKSEYYSDIEKQLNDICAEILLFLNNIKQISIEKDSVIEKKLTSSQKTGEKFDTISIDDKSWKIFSRKSKLPETYQDKSKNEQQMFGLKVAFNEELSDKYYRLFNFFPTQLSISLPCLIHGTFELNSSRDHINDSDKNRYILSQLVVLLKECSQYLANQKVDWQSFKLIYPTNSTSDSQLVQEFYQNLAGLRDIEKVFPTINNEYVTKGEYKYHNDEFSEFWKSNFSDVLPELLLPIKDSVNGYIPTKVEYNINELVTRIDELSPKLITIQDRANVIEQLVNICHYSELKFSLLLNDKKEVIPSSNVTFTPAKNAPKELTIPGYAHIDLMNSDLYEMLEKKYEAQYDPKEPIKSRELQRILKNIVNVQPYDSNNVIDQIIAHSNTVLKNGVNDEHEIVKEMVYALFSNYLMINNRQEKLKGKVPIISKSNKITSADTLFLNSSYPSGIITEEIYQDVYTFDNYVANKEYWNLQHESDLDIENFFLWLGVNRYSKLSVKTNENYWANKDYYDFILNNIGQKPQSFKPDYISKNTYLHIDNFDNIIALSATKLLLLINKDEVIQQLLLSNSNLINWFYFAIKPPLETKYSFIRYQFIKSKRFSALILEDGGIELDRLINSNLEIDYKYLNLYNIEKVDAQTLLLKIGAKSSFDNLSSESIYSILQSLEDKDIDKQGKYISTIYKMALDSLVKQDISVKIPQELRLFAETVSEKGYYPIDSIFYSDNNIFPKHILDNLKILKLQKRSGEDNVSKYLGVKTLKELNIIVDENSIELGKCNNDFQKYYELIKPFLLAYRLGSPSLKRRINEYDVKKREALAIKNSSISLVKSCTYTFDGTKKRLEKNEYISHNGKYYLNVDTIASVDELKKQPLLCDAFAEIMCAIFKVNDLKNDFRNIFKSDYVDTKHLLGVDFNEEFLVDISKLLGVSKTELNFWENIFNLKQQKLDLIIESDKKLYQIIKEKLNIELDSKYSKVDFEHFNNPSSVELIKMLVKSLDLPVKSVIYTGLSNWHNTQLGAAKKDYSDTFRMLLWSQCNEKINLQKRYIQLLEEYELLSFSEKANEIRYSIEVNYTDILKDIVRNKFDIELNNVRSNNVGNINLYSLLFDKYNLKENDIENNEIRSLVYFKGNDDAIENDLTKVNQHIKDLSSNNKQYPKVSIIEAQISSSTIVPRYSNMNGGKHNWVHNAVCDLEKKNKGKIAEELVYNSLIDMYGVANVKWVSGNSNTPNKNDALHYDIEYKDTDIWRFLEVKAISNGQFILSQAEKEEGIKMSDRYDMALFDGCAIYMIKNPFIFADGESFENNTKFNTYAKDYIITFNIQEKE